MLSGDCPGWAWFNGKWAWLAIFWCLLCVHFPNLKPPEQNPVFTTGTINKYIGTKHEPLSTLPQQTSIHCFSQFMDTPPFQELKLTDGFHQ